MRPCGSALTDSGKPPHLVSARTAIPRLGNELDGARYEILGTDLEKVRPPDRTRFSGAIVLQDKSKSVDVKLVDPIAQAVSDHVEHGKVYGVSREKGEIGASTIPEAPFTAGLPPLIRLAGYLSPVGSKTKRAGKAIAKRGVTEC
jgi:hypothetical protein